MANSKILNNFFKYCVLAFFLYGSLCRAEDNQVSDIISDAYLRMEKMDAKIVSPTDKLIKLDKIFSELRVLVNKAGLSSLKTSDVDDYFRSADKLAFYSLGSSHVKEMRRSLDELERRGAAKRAERQTMLDTYIEVRWFRDATKFAAKPINSDLKVGPLFIPNARRHMGRSIWTVAPNGDSMNESDVSIDKGAKIIVVSSPWCHFSQNASAAIFKDEAMSAEMAKISLWIMPQTRLSKYDEMVEWNKRYVDWPIHEVNLQSDWPEIPSWATPGFFFFQNGKLVSSVIGWPGPEQLEALRASVAKLH